VGLLRPSQREPWGRYGPGRPAVIDAAVTLMGSYNWTRGAAANSENLNLVSSPAVAAAYAAHWRERLAVSIRYERREDWCWVSRSTMQLRGGRGGDA